MILPIAKVSEEVKVQLSTPYTDPMCHNTLHHRQTDRQTDGSNMPIADLTACSSTIAR